MVSEMENKWSYYVQTQKELNMLFAFQWNYVATVHVVVVPRYRSRMP